MGDSRGRGIAIALLLGVFFVLTTHPVFDGDLFWHIKTGEYIWNHGALPSEDPFTFTARGTQSGPERLRQEIILKGYWISQLAYYAVYAAFGIPGIVVFRALTALLILLVLWAWMRRLNVGFMTTVVFLVLVAVHFSYMGDRPQNLSTLLFVVTAALLDLYCCPGRPGSFPRPLLLLPPIFLLWSNAHGGFIAGVILAGIYAVGALARALRDASQRRFCAKILVLLAFSIALSLANPNTYRIYPFLLQEMREGVQALYVAEMMSPLKAAFVFGNVYVAYFIFLGTVCIALIGRIRHISPERALALLCFAILSLKATRAIWFFLMLAPVVSDEITRLLRGRFRLAMKGAAAVAILVALLSLWDSRQGILDFSVDRSFPAGATRFLNDTRPQGNLFNVPHWGGYVMLMAPEYRVFTDGRRLSDHIEYVQNAVMLAWGLPGGSTPAWGKY
ncbi:MAG: hypothetical protein ACWGN7_07775, partial [Thermodesulfovibrionales bacterium]